MQAEIICTATQQETDLLLSYRAGSDISRCRLLLLTQISERVEERLRKKAEIVTPPARS